MSRSSSTKCVEESVAALDFQLVHAKLAFAVQLKKAMDREGVTPSELAKRLEVSRPMVSKLLSGEANVTIDTMVKAAYRLRSRLYLNLANEHASPTFVATYSSAKSGVSAAMYARVGAPGRDQADAA